jgi:uncharacterized membrane protein
MAVRIHVISILIAFIASFFIFFNKKGTQPHKAMGWVFVAGMSISAISSFWIPKFAHFSFIHILSVAVLCWLVSGVWSIRKRPPNLYKHMRAMGSAYISIWIAGAGATIRHYIYPGRADYGGIASLIATFIAVPIMIKLISKFRPK